MSIGGNGKAKQMAEMIKELQGVSIKLCELMHSGQSIVIEVPDSRITMPNGNKSTSVLIITRPTACLQLIPK